jgi:F-type H+-transporting ATPase subunit b
VSSRALASAASARSATTAIGIRALSTQTPTPTPEQAKATSIIDSLPGNSGLSKTGILATATAASVYAISNELYVLNEESILLGTFAAFVAIVAKYVSPLYSQWADERIKSVTDILNSSRTQHVEAVKDRIESVSELKDVVQTTKVLFEISKETVELEAAQFELKQKVELATEARAVLDSWVRYEASVRQLEQQQLTSTVIGKIEKELSNPKFQEKVLSEAVADIEKVFAAAK